MKRKAKNHKKQGQMPKTAHHSHAHGKESGECCTDGPKCCH